MPISGYDIPDTEHVNSYFKYRKVLEKNVLNTEVEVEGLVVEEVETK